MPKQFGSTVMFTVFLVAIAVAANRAEENADVPARRGPASIARIAEASPKLNDLPHTEKLRGPITVTIELVGNAPATAGDVFVVRGQVYSDQSLENVTYRWALPKDVELVNGVPRGQIAHLNARNAFTAELTLRARGPANTKVHLLATAKAHGARFAESAQFNTTRQAAFAKGRARLRKSTLKSAAEDDLKVFH